MPETIETKVAVLEHDVASFGSVLSRLDDAIDKIGDVSNCINKMLAVHEQRLTEGDTIMTELKRDVRDIEEAVDADIKELHSRVTTNHRELEEKMSKEIDKVLDAIKDLKTHMVGQQNSLEERIAKLERLRWIVIGGALVVAFLIGNTDILSFLS